MMWYGDRYDVVYMVVAMMWYGGRYDVVMIYIYSRKVTKDSDHVGLTRKNRVTIFLNGQFIIFYTCKPHINYKYSLVIITPRIFSSKMLYFG
jgi:hypothetical protein